MRIKANENESCQNATAKEKKKRRKKKCNEMEEEKTSEEDEDEDFIDLKIIHTSVRMKAIRECNRQTIKNLNIARLLSIILICFYYHYNSSICSQQNFSFTLCEARRAPRASNSLSSPNSDVMVPYKTFYVTQACEWKSNLFVPKSNDIHFAQQQQGELQTSADQDDSTSQSTTIFSTTAKALILALPIEQSADFAGYEPACSIRLIVPRNMRILAKLTARKLTFEQQQASGDGQLQAPQLWLNVSQNQFASELEERTLETEANVLAFRFLLERQADKSEPETRLQVVLTAFQTLGENSDLSGGALPTQFICDSQRLISANLACDGFRNCQDGHDEEPATCAAFRHQQQAPPTPPLVTQHLGGVEGGGGGGGTAGGKAKNQQLDGTTTTAANKSLLNFFTLQTSNSNSNSPLVGLLLGLLLLLLLLTCCTCCLYCLFVLLRNHTRNSSSSSGGGRARQEVPRAMTQQERLVARAAKRHQRRLARQRRDAMEEPRRAGNFFANLRVRALGGRGAKSDLGPPEPEADSLARSQNLENAARLKASEITQPPPPRHIQSILKRPSAGSAPLARFESIPYAAGSGEPTPPPPPPPRLGRGATSGPSNIAPPRRGALASSLTSASTRGPPPTSADFRPTPAARQVRPPTQQQQQPFVQTDDHLVGLPPAPPRSQQQMPPQLPVASTSSRATGSASYPITSPAGAADELRYKSEMSRVERTSSRTDDGRSRLTVYEYSSQRAQYSESYLVRQSSVARESSDLDKAAPNERAL